jgi:hypothetical protein
MCRRLDSLLSKCDWVLNVLDLPRSTEDFRADGLLGSEHLLAEVGHLGWGVMTLKGISCSWHLSLSYPVCWSTGDRLPLPGASTATMSCLTSGSTQCNQLTLDWNFWYHDSPLRCFNRFIVIERKTD